MNYNGFFGSRTTAELTQLVQVTGSSYSGNGIIEMTNATDTGFSEAAHPEDIMYQNAATCPDCGGGMVRCGGCLSCLSCGLSNCGG